MNRRERLVAELALAELEEAFVAKKEAGELTAEDKYELRAAREAYRLLVRAPADNGAQPATIGAEAEVEEL